MEEFHPDLKDANIAFIYRSDEGKQITAKTKFGDASKIPEKFGVLLDYDFLIWVQKQIFEKCDIHQKEAIIDHLLCHCGFKEKKPVIRQHDFEEFNGVIERHGLWNKKLANMGKAAQGYVQPAFEKVAEGTPGSMTVVGAGQRVTLTGEQLDRINRNLRAKNKARKNADYSE